MDENHLKNYIEYTKNKIAEEKEELSEISEISDNDYLKCLNERGFLYGTIIWKIRRLWFCHGLLFLRVDYIILYRINIKEENAMTDKEKKQFKKFKK